MEDFIRKLTHDNHKFNSQWDKIEDELTQKSHKNNIISIINALVEYVLQEPQIPYPSERKFEFLTLVIDTLDYKTKKKNDNSILDHVFQVFIQVFDQGQIDLWHLTFLKNLYQHFELEKYLPQKLSFIEQLFLSLQKHPFTLINENEYILESWEQFWRNDIFNDDLLNEKILELMKDKFQQLFRFGIQNSSSSPFWSGITSYLIRNLPQLFNSYINPTDAQVDLDLYCNTEEDDYKRLIRKNFSNQINLFKTNYTQILLLIERLLLKNNFKETENILEDILLKHFSAIPNLESLLHMFIQISPKIPKEHCEEFTTRVISDLCNKLEDTKANKKFWPLFYNFAIVVLELHTFKAPSCAEELLTKENFYPWKEFGERLDKIIHLCGSYDDYIVNEKSYFSKLDSLGKILSTIYDRAKVNNNLFRNTHAQAFIYTLRWTSSPNMNDQQWPIHVYKMGIYMINLIDRKQITLDTYSQLLQKVYDRIQIEDIYDETEGTEEDFFVHLAEHLGTYTDTLKTLSSSIHNLFNSMFLVILDQPPLNEDGTVSFGHKIFHQLWTKILETLTTVDDARIYDQLISKLYTLARNDTGDETDLFLIWCTFWYTVGIRFPQVADNHIETLLDEFIDRHQLGFVNLLQNSYLNKPEPFHVRITKIIQICFENNSNNQDRNVYFFLLQSIGKHHSETISSTHIDHIFTSLSKIKPKLTDNELHSLFQFLAPIASTQPNLFDKYQQDLIHIATETQNTSVFYCLQQYFISSTIINGEKVVNNHLDKIIRLLQHKSGCTQDNRNLIIHACELIGIRHKQAFEKKRNDFVTLNCEQLVHFIDNSKMTEDNKQALEQSRQEIEVMEKRLQKTETNVQQVKSTVKRQELNITNMHAHVNTLDTRLQNVNERVDIHQKEIERIDAKTLSYVPIWAGNICKLLNRRASNDWRLLGRRFGYSSSELQHWATQFDPCMALLNEWYMTHKTDEATFGLIKILKEIGRQDVEEIIRKAMKDAGEIIPDNIADIDVHRLPPIFISYQWNSQAMIVQLKNRLEEAGYLCWLDIGQMGGGQELYSKIDKAIRGAKVILCCMDKEYAKTDTCIGQVNLAISTGKPLIPLQMEKQTWPPEGALGPLMIEYLFIRFFDRKAMNDPNFWPDDKFTELLGQIRYYVAPDPEMISERYKNWFVPRVENLIFLKQANNNNNQINKEGTKTQHASESSLVDTPLVVIHPQIMISYQWDRQSDIISLYKQLTKLGYRVWLDIFQMGGGDSLFAKIDTGIRNAQCVLACVTSKYTLSTNCRREMSLADSLGKPIIPLLLEKLSENWPPAGPMSLVFTDKLYIDFSTHQSNNMWQSKEFDQILIKLKQFVPEVQIEHPEKHLISMERPSSAAHLNKKITTPTSTLSMKRTSSDPIVPQSQACLIM